MKIEATVIEMESGEVTVLEYQNVLFFQHPPIKEKPEHKPEYNPYFRRR